MSTKGFCKHEVAEYEKKRYRGIDQRIVHARERMILKKILRKIHYKSTPVLDMPCGYGRFTELLLDEGLSVVNSDISFFMVKRANDRLSESGRFKGLGTVADAKIGLPFKSGTFCVVFSMRFFHHLFDRKDREIILQEFARTTSRWVIFSFYQVNPLHLLQRRFRRKLKKSKTRINMISRQEIQNNIEKCGLKIVKVFPLIRGLHSQHIALLENNQPKN